MTAYRKVSDVTGTSVKNVKFCPTPAEYSIRCPHNSTVPYKPSCWQTMQRIYTVNELIKTTVDW